MNLRWLALLPGVLTTRTLEAVGLRVQVDGSIRDEQGQPVTVEEAARRVTTAMRRTLDGAHPRSPETSQDDGCK